MRLFLETESTSRLTSWLKMVGIFPMKEFKEMLTWRKLWQELRDVGIGPVIKFLERSNRVRSEQLPAMAVVRFKVDNKKALRGISPERRLKEMLGCLSVPHWPIPIGRLPERLLFETSSHERKGAAMEERAPEKLLCERSSTVREPVALSGSGPLKEL